MLKVKTQMVKQQLKREKRDFPFLTFAFLVLSLTER